MTTTPVSIESDIDLFTDDALHDPYPLYKELRDRGPATYLSRHGVWFLSRYEQVRAELTDWETYSSASGPGLNPIINEAWAHAVISVDPPIHTQMRKLFTDRLGPRQVVRVRQAQHRLGDVLGRLAAGQQQFADPQSEVHRPVRLRRAGFLLGHVDQGLQPAGRGPVQEATPTDACHPPAVATGALHRALQTGVHSAVLDAAFQVNRPGPPAQLGSRRPRQVNVLMGRTKCGRL